MTEITANVNWIAVAVGTIASFLLGWLWYSPKLFGAKWAEGVGVKPGAADAMPAGAMMAQLAGTVLLSWVVGVTAAREQLLTIILVVVMAMVLIIANGLFARKNSYAITVEAGFIAAMAVVMIVVQGIF
jgi:Protein of unknown function (DUF1761)